MIGAPLPHLWLAIYQSLWLPVGTSITYIQTAQGLTVQVMVSGEDAALLSHDCVVLRRGSVGRSYNGTMAVTGDVVWAHELTPGDAEVGGHG